MRPAMTAAPTNSNSVPASFFWYDLETSGTHPGSDRIMQFAGMRSDAELVPIGRPTATYLRLAPDVVPSPEACLVTGITPQRANAEGVEEWHALRRIDAMMRQPGTCVVGYNNLRFDDDFLRYGLYRNLMDPYAREWQDGNSRWDLIDLVRAAYALRPEGVCWPQDEGVVSFKLERLSAANAIAHEGAHDALADVRATVHLARRIKAAQPRLWHFALTNRSRDAVQARLLPLGKRLCVHISQRFSNERSCAAPVISVARHPEIGNRIIVADLSRDIAPLIDCDVAELAERLFAPYAETPEAKPSDERPPLKAVVMNRCPFVAPISAVRRGDAERLRFDFDVIDKRRRMLNAQGDLAEKIAEVYRRPAPKPAPDAELALYEGFVEDTDKRRMERLQEALTAMAPWPGFEPEDDRLRVLGSRLKARLKRRELAADERASWHEHIQRCLAEGFGRRPSLAEYRRQVTELLAAETDPSRRRTLRELAAFEPAAP